VVERIIFAVLLACALLSAHYAYGLGVLHGYIASRGDARTDGVRRILARHGLKTHNELASEEIAQLRAKAARDAEALDALTTWVYEQAGEWSGWTDKMAAHRLVLLLRKTGREPLGGPP
jgi:hypothetical protein